MKNIVVITCLVLLLSCCKKASSWQNSLPELSELPDSSYEKLPIRSDLLNAWNEYRKVESGEGGINDTAICYYIYFHRSSRDSLAVFSFIICDYIENIINDGYKGMVNIDDYYVAVLDPENIGKDFYNSNLLIQKDIKDLKCVEYVNGKIIGSGGKSRVMKGISFTIKYNRIEFDPIIHVGAFL